MEEGSDSAPSEDNMDQEDINKIMPDELDLVPAPETIFRPVPSLPFTPQLPNKPS